MRNVLTVNGHDLSVDSAMFIRINSCPCVFMELEDLGIIITDRRVLSGSQKGSVKSIQNRIKITYFIPLVHNASRKSCNIHPNPNSPENNRSIIFKSIHLSEFIIIRSYAGWTAFPRTELAGEECHLFWEKNPGYGFSRNHQHSFC